MDHKPSHIFDYYDLVAKKDFHQLLSFHEKYESYIRLDVSTIITRYFQAFSKETKQIYILNHTPVLIAIDSVFSPAKRDYSLGILLANGTDNKPLSVKIDLMLLGNINTIAVSYPKGFANYANGVLEEIRKHYVGAYGTFEKRLMEEFIRFQDRQLSAIHDRINIEIERCNKPRLLNNYWLSISVVKAKHGEEGTFTFALNRESFAEYIKIIKESQSKIYTPFQFLCSLLVEETPDNGLEQFRNNKTAAFLDFEKMASAELHNNPQWLIQQKIFKESKIVVNYICRTKGTLLCFCYANKYHSEFKQVIKPILGEIFYLFDRNVPRLKPAKSFDYQYLAKTAGEFLEKLSADTLTSFLFKLTTGI